MSHHILLVDDDRLILSTLGSGLRQAGYTVTEAASGEAALALTQRQPPFQPSTSACRGCLVSNWRGGCGYPPRSSPVSVRLQRQENGGGCDRK